MKYHKILYNDLSNGEGMRISYFCQGCSIGCKECFNFKLRDFKGGELFTNKILEESLYVFKTFETAYDGITLIGGECMDNIEFGIKIAFEFKKRFKHKDIWIYSGYTYEEILSDKNKLELLKLCDILVDGQFIVGKKDLNLKYRGSSNQRVIDVQESLKQRQVVLSKYN